LEGEVRLRLVLVDPPAGIDYGVQKGNGANYETLFVQQRASGDVSFEFPIAVRDSRAGNRPNFSGPFAQGPASARFVYVDVGTYAGQKDTSWSRRMKVPLDGITWALVKRVIDEPGCALQARIPGTGKDGGPNCATVTLLGDWELVKASM
jgi:hypothetical protein